jgi:hypothetical protein
MDIQDKHALLVVVTTAAKIGDTITVGSNEEIARFLGISPKATIVGLGDPTPRRITVEGVEIFKIILAEPNPAFEANTDIVAHIAFEKCGGAELIPVIDVLRIMRAGPGILNRAVSGISA